MLNKNNFAIAKLSATEAKLGYRSALNGLHIENDKTVATEGHLLCIMTGDNIPAEQYPLVESFTAQPLAAPVTIDAGLALRIERAIPKSKIPVLSRVNVGTNGDGETPALVVTDLENPQIFKLKDMGGKFVDYEQCVPSKADAKVSVSFDPKLMRDLLAALDSVHSKDDVHSVTMYLTDGTAPILLVAQNKHTEQTATGVIMPMKIK